LVKLTGADGDECRAVLIDAIAAETGSSPVDDPEAWADDDEAIGFAVIESPNDQPPSSAVIIGAGALYNAVSVYDSEAGIYTLTVDAVLACVDEAHNTAVADQLDGLMLALDRVGPPPQSPEPIEWIKVAIRG
jgi:hypothetical protein